MEKYQTKIQGLKLGEPNKKIHLDMLVSGPHGAVFSAIFKQQLSSQLDKAGAVGKKRVGNLELNPTDPISPHNLENPNIK